MRRSVVVLPVILVALVVGACGTSSDLESKDGSGGESDRSDELSTDDSTTTTTPVVTADPPLAFEATTVELPAAALQSNLAGDVTSRFMTLHGRTAYIVEPDRLSAVDVLTGDESWEAAIEGAPADPDAQAGPFVNDAGPRPPVLSADGETVAVAVPVSEPGKGTTPGHEAISVLAVDADSGKEQWATTVDVAEEMGYSGEGATTSVVAVTDDAVVVTYHNDDSTTAAIDPSTQEVLWQRDSYLGEVVVGDVVVGMDGAVAENSSMNQATGLDLTTGDQRWVTATQSSGVDVVPASEDLVVIDRIDYGSGDPSLYFVEPGTGEVTKRYDAEGGFGASAFGPCQYDQRSVVVCISFDQLTAYDATDGSELWALPDETANRVAPSVTTVWHGALYGTTENGPVVLDAATGEDRETDPGLAPHWVSEYAGIGLDDDGAPVAHAVKDG
jgi:hypothetical protein